MCPCIYIHICVLQVLHRFEVRVNRGAEGKSAKVFVGQLSEENALELAGKVISESFVWVVGNVLCCPASSPALCIKCPCQNIWLPDTVTSPGCW